MGSTGEADRKRRHLSSISPTTVAANRQPFMAISEDKKAVITKCYHLFCNPCVQRIIESHHRKCPVCAASFGPNDVKPVYI